MTRNARKGAPGPGGGVDLALTNIVELLRSDILEWLFRFVGTSALQNALGALLATSVST